jgi:hypothetical protein
VINPRVRSYSVRRYYDPGTGQFISVDPAVDQTEAPYAYVDGDPVDNADPTGLFCIGSICTHSFDPSASLDAIVNLGRGATFGLTDRVANWIVPGASCTVPQNSLDQFIGNAATTLLGGEALDALLGSARLGDFLTRLKAIDWADQTGSLGYGELPARARTYTDFDEAAAHLDRFHGIDPRLASARLHAIKDEFGLSGAENVLIDRTGNVYDQFTREWLGSLTQGGGG